MMNYIWSFLIIISIIFALLTGNIETINNTILKTSYEALINFGVISSNIILWSGILEVCVKGGFMSFVTRFFKPIIKPLFQTKDEKVLDYITANLVCNLLALGSASTPFGIKAMQGLKQEAKDSLKESNDMATLVIINACGFSIMPTSLIALRLNHGGGYNHLIIFYSIVISLSVTIIMLIIHMVVKRWR